MELKRQKTDDHIRLPESVELCINRIISEKLPPPPEPLKGYARKLLREIGEPASLEILSTILSSKKPITSFSGFISYLVRKNYPNHAEAVLGLYNSPTSPHRFLSSPSSSTCPKNDQSLLSPLSNLQRKDFHNVSCQLSFEDEAQERRSSVVRDVSSPSREHGEMAGSFTISPQLLILDKLEYRKLFLLLSYMGRRKLEAVLTVDDSHEVYRMKDLSMTNFETKIWNKYGQKEVDRIQHLDWDSGKTHIYFCNIEPDGSYFFKGPYLHSVRTHLQRSLGDDNVLIVKFLEDGTYPAARKIVEEGLFVGLKRFRFFVFKDDRKKVKKSLLEKDKKPTVKCYFVHFDSISSEDCILSGKSVSEARSLFMHIHTLETLEKYMARFSLILSKTTNAHLDFAAVTVETIEDIPFRDDDGSIIHDEDGKPILHTDGTGYISRDLAMKCSEDLHYSKYKTASSSEPLLIQCRLFHDGSAVKGTLLVNLKLEPGRIQVRPSMIKVHKDQKLQSEETFNSLEIVGTSGRPHRNYLSKYLITLLSYGGVPEDFFLNLLINALDETQNLYTNRRVALQVASLHDGLDWGSLAQKMICSGIPINEPYLQVCLSKLENTERTKLKQGRIPVGESFYLMGTADPTGVLNNDQVCVILDSGQISGKVLVYRNPGLHFGDIHVMEAVYVKELEEYVGNAKYGIFFSTKGRKSAAYEMATGDFDGDMYWVSRNPELLNFKASEPWRRVYSVPGADKRNPEKSSNMELEHQLFKLFLEARKPSSSMGIAADSWLAYMDRLLTLGDDCASEKNLLKTKMLKLIDVYYDALDAPKSGKKIEVPNDLRAELFPHHMERGHEISYKSSSILGKIYDRVQAFCNEAEPRTQIWKLPCFDIPIPEIHMREWKDLYDSYRKEMMEALNSDDESKADAADEVINKYKQILYDAPDMEESTKDTQVIYKEAVAIYHVTYDYAIIHGVQKCGFAWKVAGSALCNLYAWSTEKPLMILPSFLRELLN